MFRKSDLNKIQLQCQNNARKILISPRIKSFMERRHQRNKRQLFVKKLNKKKILIIKILMYFYYYRCGSDAVVNIAENPINYLTKKFLGFRDLVELL